VPELASDQPVELAMTVPLDGGNLLPDSRVNVPENEKSAAGWVVGVSLTVNETKFSVPELAILQPVVLAVTVPEDGGNLLPEAMVKALLKEKSPVG